MRSIFTKMDEYRKEALGKAKPDFPEFVGPMIVKELRQGMRARRFVVPFIFVHVLMVWALFVDLDSSSIWKLFRLLEIDFPLEGQSTYWLMVSVILLGVVPLGGLGLLQQETLGANVELLLMTRLSRWKVVCGQWLVLCLQGGLIFLVTLPYLMVRYSFVGGMNIPATFVAVATLLCLQAMGNALAVALSGFDKWLHRILLGFLLIGSVFFTALIIIGSGFVWILEAASHSPNVEESALIFLVGLVATTAYFTILFLQIGRAKIRLYERLYEPSQSSTMVTMAICSPLIFGFGALATVGFGALPMALLLTWSNYCMDRMPSPPQTESKVDEPLVRV